MCARIRGHVCWHPELWQTATQQQPGRAVGKLHKLACRLAARVMLSVRSRLSSASGGSNEQGQYGWDSMHRGRSGELVIVCAAGKQARVSRNRQADRQTDTHCTHLARSMWGSLMNLGRHAARQQAHRRQYHCHVCQLMGCFLDAAAAVVPAAPIAAPLQPCQLPIQPLMGHTPHRCHCVSHHLQTGALHYCQAGQAP